MKCTCPSCQGDGHIYTTCPDCYGDGSNERCISQVELDPGHDELLALQSDARKAISDTERLIERNPSAAASYRSQLSAVLDRLNQQADRSDQSDWQLIR